MTTFGKDLTIALLGKTGHGKSALGNSIMGAEKFEEADNFHSQTRLITTHIAEKNGLIYTVCDTRGLFDAENNPNKDIRVTIKHMTRLMKEFTKVDVFLYVIRFSILSNEDYIAIERLKKIFGPHFIRDHCYLVMTFGDNYDQPIPFDDYCEQAKGKFRELYNECGKRIFLISNKGGYEENSTRIIQGDTLTAKLQAWLANKSPYKFDKEFNDATLERKMLAFEAYKEKLMQKINQQIEDLTTKVKEFEKKNKVPSKEIKRELQVLSEYIIQSDPDSNTENLETHLKKVENLIQRVESQSWKSQSGWSCAIS